MQVGIDQGEYPGLWDQWIQRIREETAMNPFLDQHAISCKIARCCTLQEGFGTKSFILIGAASGDRTHDILSHSQAFCR
jgi:hypothetical protein